MTAPSANHIREAAKAVAPERDRRNGIFPTGTERGYTHVISIHIERSKHRVYIPVEMSVAELMAELENVPDNATVDEIVAWTEDTHYIEFHHEKVKEE